jgi:hypothetical protein
MPDLSDEQEIFAATEVTDDTQAAAEPVEAPAAQPEAQPAQEPVQAPSQPEEHPGAPAGFVPYGALKEEREGRKALQSRLEQQEALLNRLLQAQPQQQQPQQPKEPETPPDLFMDPDAYIRHQLTPFEAQLQETREYYSQREAIREHGKETVEAAYNALGQAMQQRDPNAIALWQKAMRSPDPYGELVNWHKRNLVISEVGTDPKAFEERIRAKILAELQGQAPAGQQPAGAPVQQPSNSNQQPLPSLNRSYGNAGNVQGGAITEEDIFNAAPAFGRRKA